MTNFKPLQLRLKKLGLQRVVTAPHTPPLVICAPAPDGQPHIVSVYSSHQEPPWQYGGSEPPSHLLTSLQAYGCSLTRDVRNGEVFFRPSWFPATPLPKLCLSAPQTKIFFDPNRFRVVVAGRRFGKSFHAIVELLQMAWRPGSEVWYVGPVYRQIKDTIWGDLKRIAQPYLRGKPNESDLSIDLSWGSRIALRSATNYESLRGAGLNGLVVDEYADIAPQAWPEVLRPMLSDRRGVALFLGTPKGRNHFYELVQRARTDLGWAQHSFTTIEGGRVAREEIEAAKRDLDEKTFRQEYEACFENYGGLVYYAFEREKNVAPQTYNPLAGLCWALDFNLNPMSSVICQIEDRTSPSDRLIGHRSIRVNVLDEIVLPFSNTYEACRVFLERARAITGPRHINLKVYGDPAGNAGSTAAAGHSDWNIVQDFLARCPDVSAAYHVPSAHPAIRDRVNAMNSILCTQSGERRLFVDSRCRQLIKDLEQVSWKEDANGNVLGQIDKRDPERTHVSDALGYLIEEEFGIHGYAGFRTERII